MNLVNELDAALKAMEASFHVRLIATFAPELVYAPAEATATSWLAANHPGFDQFPVRRQDETVGILLRQGDHGDKPVRNAMQPLSEGLIVSADMPIAELIPQLRENHCRLVLRGGRIDGLVTQSDLLKLPVRMMLFGLISHLELCLRSLIRERLPEREWLDLLPSGRRRAVLKEVRKLSQARFEPDPLELTDFSDVVQVLASQRDLGENFREDMDKIRDLRNHIAHSKTFIGSPGETQLFVDRCASINEWIDRLSLSSKVAQ